MGFDVIFGEREEGLGKGRKGPSLGGFSDLVLDNISGELNAIKGQGRTSKGGRRDY